MLYVLYKQHFVTKSCAIDVLQPEHLSWTYSIKLVSWNLSNLKNALDTPRFLYNQDFQITLPRNAVSLAQPSTLQPGDVELCGGMPPWLIAIGRLGRCCHKFAATKQPKCILAEVFLAQAVHGHCMSHTIENLFPMILKPNLINN